MTHMIETNLARELARRAGAFARLVPPGNRLYFYVGDETKTRADWDCIGSVLVDNTDGVLRVSRYTVELVLEKKRAS